MSAQPPRGVVPLLGLSGVVVLVALGVGRGFALDNAHNGLLAVAFSGVGTYVLYQRPKHPEGLLLMATGVIEAVIFYGRQVGQASTSGAGMWWAWLGCGPWRCAWHWPLCLALATLSVILFPDGRVGSTRWRWTVGVVVTLAVVCSTLSALWPVEYAAAGVSAAPPFQIGGYATASAVWSHLAHPSYAAFQVLWVVVVIQRWLAAEGHVRQQLAVVLLAAMVSVVALFVGLVGWDSPRAGLLTAALVPVAAGWAIVHGQHVAGYSALSWLSRPGPDSVDLPTGVAQAAAMALSGRSVLWMGSADRLLAVGVWPETNADLGLINLAELEASPSMQVQPVVRDGETCGAVSVNRPDPLSLSERRLLGDLAAQASLVIEHLTLADLVARRSQNGQLVEILSSRERDVLELMSQGLSNAAICRELHLSIKTVEPVVSTIFTKLGLLQDSASNRRVLAVIAYLRS